MRKSKLPAVWLVLQTVCVGLLAASLAQAQQERIRGTNTAYRQGDWIGYGVTRFVTSVAVGQQYIYFGTTGGITRFNFYTNKWEYPFTVSNGIADNYITAVAFDRGTGYLWCATVAGISYYHPTAQRWENYFKDEIGIPTFDDVVNIGVGDSDLLFETRGGRRYRIDKFGGSFLIGDNGFSGSQQQRQWFGERASIKPPFPNYIVNQGYFFLSEGILRDFRLRSAEVTCAVNDGWGKLWFGTWRFGSLQGDARTEVLDLLPFGLFSPQVGAMAFDRNGIWFGGRNAQSGESGLTYWDQARDRWVYYESQFNANMLSDDINRLVIQGDSLFVATRFGVNVFDVKRGDWSRLTVSHGLAHEFVHDIVLDGSHLWVGTEGGLNLVDLKNVHTDSSEIIYIGGEHLTAVPVLDIEKTPEGIWAATQRGLYHYNVYSRQGGFVYDAEGPVGGYVNCLYRNGDEIWLGGYGSVYGYNMKSKTWYGQPEKRTGLQTDVLAIAANDAAVWAGTDRGVYKFNRQTKGWRLFDEQDGLLDREVLAIALDGDYIWFGTKRGATVFFWNDPRRVD